MSELRTHRDFSTWEKFAKEYGVLNTNILPESYPSFLEYTKSIDAKQKYGAPFVDIGIFTLPLYHQLEVGRLKIAYDKDDAESLKVSPIAGRTWSKMARQQTTTEPPSTPTRPPKQQAITNFERFNLESEYDHGGEKEEEEDQAPLSFIPTLSPHSPASPYSALPSDDEQIVNMALLLFLNSTTMNHPNVRSGWSPQRKVFKFGDLFEARTDGFLRTSQSGRVGAIIEVKRYLRGFNELRVQMQESAQMAAWIAANPSDRIEHNSSKWRLLISQNHKEIYLTFAEYGTEYEEYVKGINHDTTGNRETLSFLTMNRYGPWDVGEKPHMIDLAVVILGFVIQSRTNRKG
ncbi:MAG: hypothetical protein M1840_004720 [Geoglossum simile]|nr:MAG: hypothetical protein M1840_004720 [Geoglossum simile]